MRVNYYADFRYQSFQERKITQTASIDTKNKNSLDLSIAEFRNTNR